MKIRPILFCAFILLALYSCQYDKADIKYPPQGVCDTSNVKYSTNIVPILNANCYICHSGEALGGGGIQLNNYSKLLIQVNNTQLLNAIQHTGLITPMPKSGGKLSNCDIATIRTWIRNGAPNN